MGYQVYKLQNTSSFDLKETPTVVITDSEPEWQEAFNNWKQGKPPSKDPAWKKGVFAVTKLKG